jgi:hypothetical protein
MMKTNSPFPDAVAGQKDNVVPLGQVAGCICQGTQQVVQRSSGQYSKG